MLTELLKSAGIEVADDAKGKLEEGFDALIKSNIEQATGALKAKNEELLGEKKAEQRKRAEAEEAARKNKVKIAGISDFTAEKVEIEIKLARGVYTEEVIDSLYAFTDCELSITPSLLVIKDDRPCIMNTSEVLQHNVDRLVDVLQDLAGVHDAGSVVFDHQ